MRSIAKVENRIFFVNLIAFVAISFVVKVFVIFLLFSGQEVAQTSETDRQVTVKRKESGGDNAMVADSVRVVLCKEDDLKDKE